MYSDSLVKYAANWANIARGATRFLAPTAGAGVGAFTGSQMAPEGNEWMGALAGGAVGAFGGWRAGKGLLRRSGAKGVRNANLKYLKDLKEGFPKNNVKPNVFRDGIGGLEKKVPFKTRFQDLNAAKDHRPALTALNTKKLDYTRRQGIIAANQIKGKGHNLTKDTAALKNYSNNTSKEFLDSQMYGYRSLKQHAKDSYNTVAGALGNVGKKALSGLDYAGEKVSKGLGHAGRGLSYARGKALDGLVYARDAGKRIYNNTNIRGAINPGWIAPTLGGVGGGVAGWNTAGPDATFGDKALRAGIGMTGGAAAGGATRLIARGAGSGLSGLIKMPNAGFAMPAVGAVGSGVYGATTADPNASAGEIAARAGLYGLGGLAAGGALYGAGRGIGALSRASRSGVLNHDVINKTRNSITSGADATKKTRRTFGEWAADHPLMTGIGGLVAYNKFLQEPQRPIMMTPMGGMVQMPR